MKLINITPELMVSDVRKTLQFYEQVFGFRLTTAVPEQQPIFAIAGKDGIEVMFYQSAAFSQEIPQFQDKKLGGTVALYVQTDDINSLYEQIKGRVKIVQPLHQTDYGSTEFSCLDLDGYVLIFNQR